MEYTFKVLSGVHKGAEIDLDTGSFPVGCGDDCEVVINDAGFAEHALDLTIGEGLSLNLIEAKEAIINGELHSKEAGQSLEISEFDLVTVQGVVFAIAQSGASWPELDLSVNDLKPAVTEQVASEDNKESVEPAAKNNGRLLSRYLPATALSLAALVAVAFFVPYERVLGKDIPSEENIVDELDEGAALDFEFKRELVEKEPSLTDGEAISEYLAENPALSGITVEKVGSKQYNLEGYVKSVDDKRALVIAMRKKGLKVRTRLYAEDEMMEAAEQIVDRFSLRDVEIKPGSELGVINIEGSVDDEDVWQKTKRILRSDISGLTSITDAVVINKAEILAKKEKQLRPNLNIKGVGLGDIPFITLDDGQRYIAGAHISDGFYLDSISGNAIKLRKGDELISYQVGNGF